MNEEQLKIYLESVIESLKDEPDDYLKGNVRAYRDILKRLEK